MVDQGADVEIQQFVSVSGGHRRRTGAGRVENKDFLVVRSECPGQGFSVCPSMRDAQGQRRLVLLRSALPGLVLPYLALLW